MNNVITYQRANKPETRRTFCHGSIRPMSKSDAKRVIRQNGNTFTDIIIISVEYRLPSEGK